MALDKLDTVNCNAKQHTALRCTDKVRGYCKYIFLNYISYALF